MKKWQYIRYSSGDEPQLAGYTPQNAPQDLQKDFGAWKHPLNEKGNELTDQPKKCVDWLEPILMLEALGQKGWELVSVVAESTNNLSLRSLVTAKTYYFKRPQD